MGNYNPHAPQILGQEWVPIRDEDLAFSPIVNSVEIGTLYTQAASQRIRDARFYVNQIPAPPNGFQTAMVNIYPAGLEDQTGPISEVIIPCSSGAITGTNMTLFGASTVAEAVYQPGDSKYIEVAYNSGTPQRFGMFFAVNQYPVLANKRILNVSLLYAGSVSDTDPVSGDQASFISPDPAVFLTSVDQMNDAGVGQTFSPPTFSANTGTLDQIASTINAATSTVNTNQVLGVLSLGDVNNFWNPAASPGSTEERLPWRYVDLQRFEASATNRMMIRIQTQIPQTKLSGTSNSVNMRLDYFALRVIYCEEKRLAYGGRKFIAYNLGANIVTMRDLSFAADPVVAAGQYLPTLSWVSPGQITFGSGLLGNFPKLNADEELYQIPSHPGIQVNVPFPLEDRIGSVFSSEVTHILPQLTLHASGGTLTDPHVYGRQAAAQVYGTNTAIQEIYDDISGVSASYPQVRYYARRFGDTTVPLTLTSADPNALSLSGAAGTYASTPDAASLDITGDIDLRADVALNDWTPAADSTLIAKYTDPANESYRLYIQTNGRVVLSWSVTGAGVLVATSTAAPTVQDFGRLAIRATMDVNDGAGNRIITFYTAPTIAGPWTQLGTPTVTAGTTSIFSGTGILEVGSVNVGTITNLAGKVYAAQVYNGIDGTLVANPDFSAQAAGTLNFVDSTGKTWTLNGAAAIVAGTSASTVSISVADFDALAEILDGWREVTLRFTTPPSMGGISGFPAWTWSATGETAGNRWEILAASAPAISGIPGNFYNLVPSPNQLAAATYQPNSGAGVNLTWMPQGVASPWVTGASDDAATDAVLIFSQDPPTITGVTLTAHTQTVTGIGLDCGTLPCCIPSGISYQQISWGLPVNAGFGFDDFNRVVAGSWGTASDGSAWQNTTSAENSVDGSIGIMQPASGGDREAWIDVGGPDQDITMTVAISEAPVGNSFQIGVVGRLTNNTNHYNAEMRYNASGTVDLFVIKRVAGTRTDIASVNVPNLRASVNGQAKIRFQIVGNLLKAKLWGITETEPVTWQIETTDSSLTTGNNAGGFSRNNSATFTALFKFDNLIVNPPNLALTALELQRYDTITQEFETIMLSDDLTRTSFNDFEARVGITSVYRIRSLNALNFAGQWSAMVSGAPPTPGVTGGCTNMTGALIFTSNADQSGASNAAYAMVWDNDPIEDFKLAEADMVTFQPMYGRDGSIAFHGTERGLEAFDRTLLLQSAAIDPTRLADAKTIRDLAWNGLPYICVRDDIGDRWFANVRIPAVNARLNRTKYMARVEITETTLTPYPVNP